MPTPHPDALPPRRGTLLFDTAAGRLGVLMDEIGGTLWLRPPSGGREWEARPTDVRRADVRRAQGEAGQ